MDNTANPGNNNHKAIYQHYGEGREAQRLSSGISQLEFARTQELLQRFLPLPPATILDIGGGTGAYSFWLAQQGYRVHLIDLIPLHIEQARQIAESNPQAALASMAVGDARKLEWPDEIAAAALLLGPLYHLTDYKDRLSAWKEAGRITRKNGLVIAAVISRFASALDGIFRGLVADQAFVKIMERDLDEGQHRNPANHPDYFTTAFLHHPEEIKKEVEDAGLELESCLMIEGPAWLSQYVERNLDNPSQRDIFLKVIRKIEAEPSLLGASAHILVVARKP